MTTKKCFLNLIIVLAVVVGLLFGGACALAASAYEGKVMKVGSVQPFTGGGSYYGWQMHSGLMCGINEINEKDLLPFKIRVVPVDHKTGDAVAGTAGIKKLIEVDKVSWIFSSWPNISLIASQLASEAKIPVVNGGGVGLELLNKPYLHNTRLNSDQITIPVLEYMGKEMGIKKPAVIYGKDPFGTSTVDVTRAFQESFGYTVVAEEGHDELYITDFRSMLTRIKAAKPDALFIWTHSPSSSYAAKQAHELGMHLPIAFLLEVNPEGYEVGGKDIEGVILGAEWFDLNNPRPEVQEFIARYAAQEKGEIPTNTCVNYYDLAFVLLESIKHVMDQGKDPFIGENLEMAIRDMKIFPTMYGEGKMELLPDGSVIKPTAVVKVHAGGVSGQEEMIKAQMAIPALSWMK